MDAYTAFAQVYDLFMDNVPYEKWCTYLCKVLREYKITEGPVLDLGCGTGEMTRRMSDAGYDMTGVDNSIEMLNIARGSQENREILYLCQPMQELELDGCVRAVYSVCDCMNYVVDKKELVRTFHKVAQCLEKGGIFLFDMNTDYKYRVLLGENTFAESRQEGSFIWENYYDESGKINEYDLTLFIPKEKELYQRYTEVHFQRNYSLEEISRMIADAGLTCMGIYDDYSEKPVHSESERVTFIVRK